MLPHWLLLADITSEHPHAYARAFARISPYQIREIMSWQDGMGDRDRGEEAGSAAGKMVCL